MRDRTYRIGSLIGTIPGVRRLLDARAHRQERLDRRMAIEEVIAAGVWFVDIPRTGSTSIKYALEERFGAAFGKAYTRETGRVIRGKPIQDHRTAIDMIHLLGEETWNNLVTFSVVRNPWERAYSLYRYRTVNGSIPAGLSFADYTRRMERLNTRTSSSAFHYAPFFMPMVNYLLDGNDRCLVGHVLRFENLAADLRDFCIRTGLDFRLGAKMEVLRIGDGDAWRREYDEETRERIARLYADDIEQFAYRF